MRWIGTLAAAAALLLTAGNARAEELRYALVIANQSYAEKVGPLKTPLADAVLVKAALEDHDFKVTRVTDASRLQILAAVREHARLLEPAGAHGVGIVYYAGHGASPEGSGRNYVIPVTATDARSDALWDDSVPLDEIRRRLAQFAPEAAHIVVFDACREELDLGPADRSLGAGRGRGFEIEPKAWGSMMVAFSTAEGELAADALDGAENSPYAIAFAAALERAATAGRRVAASELFQDVGIAVRRKTGSQTPWLSLGAGRKVFFGEDPPEPEPEPKPKPAPDPPAAEKSSVAAPISAPPPEVAAGPAPLRTAAEIVDLKPGEKFKECEKCPEMVVAPGGAFLMGSPPDEAGRESNEGPQQRIEITSFAIGVYEATYDEWEACAADGFCRSNPSPSNFGTFSDFGRGRHPVIRVSWNDITAPRGFIAWLNSKTEGAPYRLPSEAEWEYAARAGTTTRYWFGDDIADHQANYGAPLSGATMPVGSFKPNAFGLYDVHGNVWEWVQDCWTTSLGGQPADGSARMEGECSKAVLRGGSWDYYPRVLRSAYRFRNPRDNRYDYIGFRVARTLGD